MTLIDTHCHLYLPEFESDSQAMIERAEAEGIKLMMMPAIDSSELNRLLSFESRYPHCMAMMGLHPCSVKENYEEELRLVEQQLHDRKFVAIGETGLDFYWDLTFK
jgi:TatD DNase family protein